MSRVAPPALLLAVLASLAACAPEPIRWDAAVAAVDSTAVGVDSAPVGPPPPDVPGERRCEGSLRVVRDTGARRVAVWWSARGDSTTRLVAARSGDAGARWGAPVPVDSLDRGARGCARPAPAVAWDDAGGYVHVVDFLDAPEGSGLCFAHSMDDGAMFLAPVPIVYGERPVRASVAAQHDTVAVAYENPNSRDLQVSLALSRTAGHIFEEKAIPVSPGTLPAERPAVRVSGSRVTVTWRERQGGRLVPMRRTGTLR